MYYTVNSDPSDGWSNHWSNAPLQDLNEGQCPECMSENTFETPKQETKHCCKECWNKF
jgi:hypothetical protein